jgi:hypothetical protein
MLCGLPTNILPDSDIREESNMPYIPPDQRSKPNIIPTTPGELNYYITQLCQEYVNHQGGVTYTNINNVIGALECAKAEYYRRIATPYEDAKMKKNGDVYEI